MRESQRRIKEYQERLPRLKEKVAAVLLLLAVSASMLVTVSFAWVSLSTNPEVAGVNTSIASNGNLEIALATGTLDEYYAPGASQVGDSNLATVSRNITWGNLINLADPSYGLENLVLRPALLNTFGLVNNPLYGPVYDESGRVIDMNTNFGYSKWQAEMNRFASITDVAFEKDQLGVRAITSMKYGDASENATAVKYNQQLNSIEAANSKVQTNFQAIANVEDHQDALASLMTGYMVENQLKTNPSHGDKFSDAYLYKADLEKCISMYNALITCFKEEAVVIANLLNLQAEVNGSAVRTSSEEILALAYNVSSKTASNALVAKGFTAATNGFVAKIDQFLADYNTLQSDLVRLGDLIIAFGNNTRIYWKDCPVVDATATTPVLIIDDIINNLVNVKKCAIATDDGSYSGTIGGVGLSAAMDLNGKYCMTTINNGILYNLHSFCGGGIETSDYLKLEVTVRYIITINGVIYSKIETASSYNYFDIDRAAVSKAISKNFGEAPLIANDTYGFAVDLWVRTNADHSYLTLQGNILTDTKYEPAMGKDANGDAVKLYTITVAVEDETPGTETDSAENGGLGIAVTQSYDVYKAETKDENGNTTETWYFADNHTVVTAADLGLAEDAEIPAPVEKINEIEYVIGYEGDNRVWEGDQHSILSVNSTTQGSGSCYVFYAETPVDQERSLELLKSMKVAFVDASGNLLATAHMDSERHYADSGKVIVPLILDSDSLNIGTDDDGNPIYAITALEQNVATRITAIVYLDGTDLTNEDVLASADIEGKMNIQFGSSTTLYPIDNEELYNAELIAEVQELSPNSFDYDTLADGEKMESTVKVKITGTQPTTVTANFIRRINATQGSPEGSFTLTDADGDGVWEGTYEFLYPGTYIIRSVTLDGTERDLLTQTTGEFPTVVVNGFTVSRVSELSKKFVMSGENSHTENLTVSFASNDPDKMPKTVVGKFIRDDGAAVNVNFSYDPSSTSWKGVAKFVSSGEYTMQYLVLDGQYVELTESHQRSIELILGMRVRVETISPTTMIYGEDDTPEFLQMQVELLDNNGDIIPNLANTQLFYAMGGTTQLHTGLLWNAVEELYEGEFKTEPGTWNFSHVVVSMGSSSNTLTNVNSDAPVFTIIPPTPPTYISNSGVAAQYLSSDTDKGIVTVTLKDATSAILTAKLVNVDNGTVKYIMPKTQKEGGYFYETLGEVIDGKEVYYQNFQFNVDDGLWELVAVSAFNVFDSDSKPHLMPDDNSVDTAEEFGTGIIFGEGESDKTDSGFTPTTVAILHENNIEIKLDYSNAATFVDATGKTVGLGKDKDGNITAAFMATHTLNDNGITVSFNDTNNLISRGYFDIGNVKFSYKYGTTSSTYGGYTSDAWDALANTNAGTFEFSARDTGKFILSNAVSVPFRYAAQYIPDTLSYSISSTYNDVDNGDGSVSGEDLTNVGSYTIEVWSEVPSVSISNISPTGTFDVDKNEVGAGHESTTVPAWTATEATVYFRCDREGSGTTCSPYRHNYTRPSVAISLSDMGNAESAYMQFGTDIEMYNGTTKTNIYEWSPSALNCVRNIGYYRSRTANNDDKTPAGTISSSTLVFVLNEQEYRFVVDTITINNPY